MTDLRNAIMDGLLMADKHYEPEDVADAIIEQIASAEDTSMQDIADLLEVAWVIIANAYGGDWELATYKWRTAAERWRNGYHRMLTLPEDEAHE